MRATSLKLKASKTLSDSSDTHLVNPDLALEWSSSLWHLTTSTMFSPCACPFRQRATAHFQHMMTTFANTWGVHKSLPTLASRGSQSMLEDSTLMEHRVVNPHNTMSSVYFDAPPFLALFGSFEKLVWRCPFVRASPSTPTTTRTATNSTRRHFCTLEISDHKIFPLF